MNAYCDRQSVDFNSIAFLFDGRRLRAEQTPDEVFVFFIFVYGFYILTEQFLVLTRSFFCSWRWRMVMKLMPCFIRPEVLYSEGCYLLDLSFKEL